MRDSLRDEVARFFWCGWGDGGDLPADEDHPQFVRLVEEFRAGGIILFSRNLPSAEAALRVASALEQRRPGERIFLSIDQEGGRVCRIRRPGMTYPGNMALGCLDEPAVTTAAARAIGEQLRGLGVNTNFAPCLDVNSNPENPIIGVRSFGEEPDLVSRHGAAALEGFSEAGVLPVIKHFPGHGDVDVDSHLDLPVQPADLNRLRRLELPPFQAAIEGGAPAVMSTHILFPALDPDLPSTLSRPILTGLLRDEIGFDGLVVTDCMEMRGITARWSPEEASVLAFGAGADVLLVSHTLEIQERMLDALVDAVRSGRIPRARVAASLARIERAAGLLHPPAAPPRSPAEYAALEDEVSYRCLRFSRNRDRLPAAGRPLLLLGPQTLTGPLAEQLRLAGFDLAVAETPSPGQIDSAEAVIIAVASTLNGGRPESWVEAAARHPRCLIMSCGEPYFLSRYPEGPARLHYWNADECQVRAAVRFLQEQVSDGR